mgnify:CR=1 FL=1
MLERFRRLIEAMSASNRNAALGYGVVHLLAALVGELIAEPGGRYSGLWPGVGAQGAFLVMLPTSRWWVIVLVGLLVEAIVDILRFLPQYDNVATLRKVLEKLPTHAFSQLVSFQFGDVLIIHFCRCLFHIWLPFLRIPNRRLVQAIQLLH